MTRSCAALLSVSLLSVACQVTPTREQAGWESGSCGSEQSLRGLAPVTARIAYVGGAKGTLRKTVDGGRTWLDVAPPGAEACDFRDVAAVTRDVVVAMAAGQPARLYHSANGGVTWHLAHEDPRKEAFFDAVAFDGNHGVVFGDAIDGRLCLLETFDGGRTWRDVPNPALPTPGEGEAAFAASGTCLVLGPDHFSLVTGGGPCRHVWFEPGVRHDSVDLPMQNGAAARGAFSVAWNGQRGVAVGGDYTRPEVTQGTAATTEDGGRTWQAADAAGYRSGVAWLSDQDVLAVGSHGASWSSDGGRTWAPFLDTAFHSVARAPDGAVWACGSGGRVGRLVARKR